MEAAKPHILIVEDSPVNREALNALLSECGYDITLAQDLAQADAVLAGQCPDLVLLDVGLPDGSGLEWCLRTKARDLLKDVPVVFLTAMGEKKEIAKGFEVGGSDYIIKPFSSTELLARISTQLELRRKTQKLAALNRELEWQVQNRTRELEDKNRDLRALNDKINSLDKAKNDFLLLVNHEIRTPLNGILGFSAILRQRLQDEKLRGYVEVIDKSAQRLLRFSESVSLVTRLRMDNYKKQFSPTSLHALAQEAALAFRDSLQEKQLVLVNDFEKAPQQVMTDRNLVAKCLGILLENAIRHSPQGGTLRLACVSLGGAAVLSLADEGPGFTEKARLHLFEMFHTEDILKHQSGLGMGLLTAKLIMEALAGQLRLENQAHGGAKVELELPIEG